MITRASLAFLGLFVAFLVGVFTYGEAESLADLRIANGPDPRSLDPALTSAIADGRILAALFEGLYIADPVTAAPRPGIAAGPPEIADDGLTWTIPILPGLRWSDGTPYDAHDLAWSFLRFLDPATGARAVDLLATIRGAMRYNRGEGARSDVGIRALDAHTLQFTLEQPTPWLDDALSAFPLLPVPRHVIARHGDQWTRPEHHVSNGPFKLISHRLRDRVRVAKNFCFHAQEEVTLRVIDYLCVESPGTMLNLFLHGSADIITEVPPTAVPKLIARFGQGSDPIFRPTPRLGTFMYRVNTRRAPFGDARVRRALSLAIDRQRIVDHITRAGEATANSFVPPGGRAGPLRYDPPLSCVHDAQRARTLLQEGLAAQGLTLATLDPIEILTYPDPTESAITEYLQSVFTELGLEVRVVQMDAASTRAAVRGGDYQISRGSWIGDFDDPSNFLEQFRTGSSGNRTGFSDAIYDRLLDQSQSAHDPQERKRLLHHAEARLLELSPILPIHHYVSRSMAARHVEGYHQNLLDWHLPRFLKRAEGTPR